MTMADHRTFNFFSGRQALPEVLNYTKGLSHRVDFVNSVSRVGQAIVCRLVNGKFDYNDMIPLKRQPPVIWNQTKGDTTDSRVDDVLSKVYKR